jgi:hypothetical protein
MKSFFIWVGWNPRVFGWECCFFSSSKLWELSGC